MAKGVWPPRRYLSTFKGESHCLARFAEPAGVYGGSLRLYFLAETVFSRWSCSDGRRVENGSEWEMAAGRSHSIASSLYFGCVELDKAGNRRISLLG